MPATITLDDLIEIARRANDLEASLTELVEGDYLLLAATEDGAILLQTSFQELLVALQPYRKFITELYGCRVQAVNARAGVKRRS